MIVILTGRSDTRYIHALETMFEDRKLLFVETLGWNVPVQGKFEIDAFDHARAIYIIALDDGDAHIGSLRLLPSSEPHLLDTCFARLCPRGVPVGPDTYEITRLCLPTRLGAAKRLAVRNALITALVDLALERGIARLTGVVTDRFRKDILSMGWLAEPVGPALRIEGALLGAFAVHIASDTPDRLRWTDIYQDRLSALARAEAAA